MKTIIKMFHPVILVYACATLMPLLVNAMTAEQKAKVHEHFEAIGMKCIKDHPINEDDINDLRSKKVPSSPEAPCFLACVMKDIGVMNKDGLIQKETALELAKKVFEDAEELKMIEDYLHSCNHVNSEVVSDGEKGCDRAIIAMKCMIENAAQTDRQKDMQTDNKVILYSCSHFWGGSAKYQLKALESIEKRAKRLIGDESFVRNKLSSFDHRRKFGFDI